MACGGCGSSFGSPKYFAGPARQVAPRPRAQPNPLALQQVQSPIQNMPLARRNIEQKRRLAVLRALGK